MIIHNPNCNKICDCAVVHNCYAWLKTASSSQGPVVEMVSCLFSCVHLDKVD